MIVSVLWCSTWGSTAPLPLIVSNFPFTALQPLTFYNLSTIDAGIIFIWSCVYWKLLFDKTIVWCLLFPYNVPKFQMYPLTITHTIKGEKIERRKIFVNNSLTCNRIFFSYLVYLFKGVLFFWIFNWVRISINRGSAGWNAESHRGER